MQFKTLLGVLAPIFSKLTQSLTIFLIGGLICFLFSFKSKIQGTHQHGFDAHTQKIFSEIYQFNFRSSDSLIKLLPENMNVNWKKMIRANYLWWKLMSGEENNLELKRDFIKILNEVIKDLRKNDFSNDQDLYCLITAHALKSRLNLMEGNYFKGLFNIDYAVSFIVKSLGKEKTNESFVITSGLLYYFAEYSAMKYAFTKPYFRDVKEAGMAHGLAVLERGAFSTDNIVKTESNYFLVKLYQEVEHKYNRAIPHIKSLCLWYPKNILYWYQYFDCLISSKQKEEALKVMSKIYLLVNANNTLTNNQKLYFKNKATERLKDYYKNN